MNPVERLNLIDRIVSTLLKNGYSVSDVCHIRPLSFDIIAKQPFCSAPRTPLHSNPFLTSVRKALTENRFSPRAFAEKAKGLSWRKDFSPRASSEKKKGSVLVIKVLVNADAMDGDVARSMIRIALSIGGAPVVVAERTADEPLEDGVVYMRFNVPVITPQTFTDYVVSEKYPVAYAGPGGIYADVDNERIKILRRSRNLSLSALAHMLGVSRRAIRMYEDGMNMLVGMAARLEELLEEDLIMPIRIFERTFASEIEECDEECTERERYVLERLSDIGCHAIYVDRAPFDVVAQHTGGTVLAGIGEIDPTMARRSKIMRSISEVTDSHPVIFVRERKNLKNISGSPIISFEELEMMREYEDIIETIEERY